MRLRDFILLSALAMALPGCKKPETVSVASKPALKVTLVQPQIMRMQDAISASGTITAREEVLLGVELSGVRVTNVLVDVGQKVQAGQVLLRLDTRSLQVALLQARAQYKQAQAALSVAEADARRGAVLRAKGLVSQKDVDQVQAALLNAQAGLEVADANVSSAKLNFSFATLEAPSGGIISARNVQPGSVALAGTEMLRLIKNGTLEWRADLGEASFVQVHLGDTVVLNDGPAQVTGSVRAIDAGVRSSTRTGLIYVQLPPNTNLRMGTFAQGHITRPERSVLSLPTSAIVQRDGYTYVFAVQSGVVALTRVALGISHAGHVELLQGLSKESNVVAEGGGFLSDGDKVEVIATAAATGAADKAAL
jgi:RND family efflux transporter MFP subunit